MYLQFIISFFICVTSSWGWSLRNRSWKELHVLEGFENLLCPCRFIFLILMGENVEGFFLQDALAFGTSKYLWDKKLLWEFLKWVTFPSKVSGYHFTWIRCFTFISTKQPLQTSFLLSLFLIWARSLQSQGGQGLWLRAFRRSVSLRRSMSLRRSVTVSSEHSVS